MKHEELRLLLSAYADRELAPAEAALVEGHLRECSLCSDELSAIRALGSAIRTHADVELPATFPYAVVRRARREDEERSVWVGTEVFARRLVVVLTVLVLIVIGVGTLSQAEEQIVMEPYLAGDAIDSVAARVLTQPEISTEDVLIAALSR